MRTKNGITTFTKWVYDNIHYIILITFAGAVFSIFGYVLYIAQVDTNAINRAYDTMNSGNYTSAIEQFQAILDKQKEYGTMFESHKIVREAKEGLESASTLYHYNSGLEFYVKEQYMDALYHFGQVIDYRDSFELFQKCLDAYTLTYYNQHAPG